MSDLLLCHEPSRPHRSSGTRLFNVLEQNKTKQNMMKQLSCTCMLCAYIHVQYTHICGKLPENLRSVPTLPSFKFRLKTFLFATAFYYIKFGEVHYYSLALRLNCTLTFILLFY